MAEVYDGVIYGDYSKYTRLRINYTVSQNETTAVSTITMNLYAERTKGSEQYNNSGQAYWNLTGKGNTSMKFSWAASSLEMHLGSSSTTVQHNPDGTGSVTLSGYWYTGRTGSNYIPEAISVSKNITLKTIPRASSITCSTANIGANPTISITRASPNFTHTITYAYGYGDLQKTGTIATKTSATTINTWTIPDSFYENIPNNKLGQGSLVCTTYSGDTVIGTSGCTFIVQTVESIARPKVNASLKDINATTVALTGNANKLILGKSTAQLNIISTLQKYAGSIKSVLINGTNVGTSANITKTYANVTTKSYSIITTDSREYPSETVSLNPQTINYVPLTFNATIFRPQPTGTEIQMKYSGNYFNESFGAVTNTLSITWKYRVKGATNWTNGGTITPTLSGNTISSKTISLGTNYNYQTAYDFQITAVDKLTTNTQTIAVSVGMPTFYWGKDFMQLGSPFHKFQADGSTTDNRKLSIDTGNYNFNVSSTSGWANGLKFRTNNGETALGYIGAFGLENTLEYYFIGAGYEDTSLRIYPDGIIRTRGSTHRIFACLTLFNNDSGTTGTVALSETSANFAYIEIFYRRNVDGEEHSVRVYNPNGKKVSLINSMYYDSQELVQLEAKTVRISGKTITPTADGYVNIKIPEITNIGSVLGETASIYITRVVGYR